MTLYWQTSSTATTNVVVYQSGLVDPRVTVAREFGDLGDSNQQFSARIRMLFQSLPSWRDDPSYSWSNGKHLWHAKQRRR